MKRNFPRVMKTVAAVTALATVVLAAVYHFFPFGWLLSVVITTGTTFYHFAMRLIVGSIVPHCVKNPEKNRWFHQRAFEPELYKVLKVKQWKDHMPTYDPHSFSLQHNTPEQIVYNTCVSETVHVVIVLFSFVPISFTLWWGAFPVFLTTSVLSAAIDCSFIIMQRYNRPRLIRILSKRWPPSYE